MRLTHTSQHMQSAISLSFVVAGFCLAGSPQFATAASADPELEEIIVTAQKRAERLQDVPLAVSAFGTQQLEDGKVQSILNLDGKIPNVVLAPVGAFAFAGAFSIRGIGFADVESSFEPTVGLDIDGVYLARNVGAVQDFFDIDQVTVLRGPQGTLYGRNTIGGVVSIRTKRPGQEFHAQAQGTLGSYERRELRAAVEGPIAPGVLSVRVSGMAKHFGGFYRNDDGRDLGKESVGAGRATVVFTPSDRFDATLIVDHSNDTGTGNALANASLPTQLLATIAPADADGFHSHVGDNLRSNVLTTGETLEANWDTGPVKLTSITGYRDMKTFTDSDFDGEHVRFLEVIRSESHRQFSQELRVAPTEFDKLKYVVGAYYQNQRYDVSNGQFGSAFGSPNGGSTLYAGQTARSLALFGQFDYTINDLTLTLGGRYSKDSKRFNIQPLFNPASQIFSTDFSDFSPKAALSYAWTPDVLTYFQYSRGFRSGGFNGRAGSFAAVGPYDSETVDSYEAGLKSQFLERALTLNLALFSMKYHDMQQSVQQIIPGTNVNQTVTSNAASAKLDGVEAELHAVVGRGFSISTAVGYLDARFQDFVANLGDGLGTIDRSNLPLAFAPKWTASLTPAYTVTTGIGKVTAQASARYQSEIYTSFTPLNLLTKNYVRKANTLIDANLALQTSDERWRFSLYGKNLTNKLLPNNTFAVGGLLSLRVYMPPREIGAEVGFKY